MTLESVADIPHDPRCGGCDGEWVDCWSCGGEGGHDGYEEDPLWYDEGDVIPCDICHGKGGFLLCWARRGE